VRRQPIAKVGLLLVIFRLAGVVGRYLVPPAGSWRERLAVFLPAAAAHTGVLLVVVALFLFAASLAHLRHRVVDLAACATFAVLMIMGQADFTVSSITGAPLTPTVFRTYRGMQVIRSSEFLEPLRANLGVSLGGAAAFLAGVAWMVALIRNDAALRRAQRALSLLPSASTLQRVLKSGAVFVLGLALSLVATIVSWPVPPPPIEAAFAREYLGLDRATLRGSEADAIRDLRDVVGLPPGGAWLSDEYPVVYRPAVDPRAAERRARPPDVVVVMIESLRGAELPFVTGAGVSVTPNLDRVAARSVVFPTFISNGFPSAPSVLAFHCAVWPHQRKEIITDFSTRRFDSLPGRLRTLGYQTIYVGADPHFDHQDVWLPQWYDTAVDLVAQGVPGTDRNIVLRAIDEMRRHDAAVRPKPLFAFVSTYSTHYPFRLPPDAADEAPGADDLESTYRRTLRYTDAQLGDLLSFLETRDRRTVTIVLGDHAFYTDLRKTSGVPENDTVWTAAMIAGPEDLVGRPRRMVMPASHVDLLPTVMAMVGDVRPSAALGSDLFGPPRGTARQAFAIRPGGLRFDRGGYSIVVDLRAPNLVTTRVLFPHPLPPSGPPPADIDALRMTGWANDWSYVVEKNRVWNDSLLGR
jgi:hypothetical protein